MSLFVCKNCLYKGKLTIYYNVMYSPSKAGDPVKLIYKGKYYSEGDLPVRVHPDGSVPFREANDMNKLALRLNALCIPLVILAVMGLLFCGLPHLSEKLPTVGLGIFASFLVLFPHELLHAICFKGEVELWTNLKMGCSS